MFQIIMIISRLQMLFIMMSILWISSMVSSSGDTRRMGLLETLPPPDTKESRRFCITYFPHIHNLTEQRSQAVSHLVANFTSWDGCGEVPPSPLPATTDRWVLLNQSASASCSLDERVASLQKLQAAGVVIQGNGSYTVMVQNQSVSPIPVTFISWRHTANILNGTPSVAAIQYAIPDEQPFNYSFVVIWFMANLTIVLGALWSATVKYELFILEESTRRARREGTADSTSTSTTAQYEPPSVHATAVSVIVAICLIITLLLLSYFFPEAMYYVVLVLFFMGSVSGMYTCLNAIIVRMPCGCHMGMTPTISRRPTWRVRSSSLILCAISLAVGIIWVIFRDHTWGWILQDVLGVAFSLSIIRSVRLPSLRIVTFFAVGLLIYDIFFVFITPFFTADGKSIMEEVATGGGDNIMPLVLKVPYMVHTEYTECYPSTLYSLLGYGDIILPGVAVAYFAAMDKIYTGRHIYLATSAFGYGAGLIITFVAVYAMESAQPALLYLVPMVLLPAIMVALCRRQFKLLWHGGKLSSGAGLIADTSAPGYNTVDSQD